MLTIIGIAALLCVLIYNYILNPAFFSPLSKLPTAHPLCSITAKWFDRQLSLRKELTTLLVAHQNNGPVVRLGPQEVSVVSLEGLRAIYTAGLEKHPWYSTYFANYGTPNMVSTLEHRPHSVQKRMIANVYAKSYIQRSSEVETLSRVIVLEKLLPLLHKCANDKSHLNVMPLFQWAGIDFMTAYIFGTGHYTNFLQNKHSREDYFKDRSKILDLDKSGEDNAMERVCMRLATETLASQAQPHQDHVDGTRPVVFGQLYSQLVQKNKAEGEPLSQEDLMKRCASEMLDHIIATHETFAITLTYIIYRMSLDLRMQERLRAELSTLQPSVTLGGAEKTLPPPADIDFLPLLSGILTETLRLHAAAPARQPRVVPEGGIMLHGYYIPAGTKISSNPYSLHRQADVFPRPNDWLPERWMAVPDRPKDSSSFPPSAVIRKWFWAFGSGGRMCIGSNFATHVLKLLIASIYTNFETSIVDDEGIEQSEYFIATPVGNKLIIQLHPIE
ncbi:uncharacterized protein LTR77_006870 [Saxophila tyrrhenica]|uniref:Cytochrome P450 n=1 Tax=Saxophila tyrrhenica TaxID=1690608 RepID=A0AAV9PA67_9PEZI|nr:hypothetical protein LTR77_006870 [Saxophila tyrrhenica]